ncbi:MAG: hypothetical protein HC780_15105 [Leptolyngbyaceae cyanobacterium CSU_1_3]|nr:hypothetical protein [Leptolyngbyaceae cyanobacterium CSU_1_3]
MATEPRVIAHTDSLSGITTPMNPIVERLLVEFKSLLAAGMGIVRPFIPRLWRFLPPLG